MDLLTFITEITKSLVWPCLIVFILYKIRASDIQKILKLIKSVKYKDLEITFEQEVQAIELEAEKKGLITPETNKIWGDELYTLAELHPDLAIIKAWKQVEDSIKKVFEEKLKSKIAYRIPYYKQIQLLLENDIITPDTASLIRDLSGLRNRAVHQVNHDISISHAQGFLELSAIVYKALKELL
jgi:hypothetical protein